MHILILTYRKALCLTMRIWIYSIYVEVEPVHQELLNRLAESLFAIYILICISFCLLM
jgi:hypothetical protein